MWDSVCGCCCSLAAVNLVNVAERLETTSRTIFHWLSYDFVFPFLGRGVFAISAQGNDGVG